MVVSSVKIQKLFIGQFWNMLRVSPGLPPIGRVWKQGIHNFSFQHFV